MKKKTAMLILATLIIFLFVACGGGNDNSADKEQSTQEDPEDPKPELVIDLSGEWKQVNGNSETDYITAVIADGMITVNFVFEEEDAIALYWAGSYIAPTTETEKEGFSWVSFNDTEKTSAALMASSEETKDFEYIDGQLNFELTALDSGITVTMERVQPQD